MTHIHLLKVCLGSCWDSVQASLIFIHFPIPNEENVTKKVRILDVSCRCFMMGAETWDFGDFIHWGIQECSYSGCSYFSFPSISITFQPEDIKDWTSLEVSWSYESLRVRVFFPWNPVPSRRGPCRGCVQRHQQRVGATLGLPRPCWVNLRGTMLGYIYI